MMKSIRRSMKGDSKDHHNAGARLTHMSITPKSALTIIPPKKVIRAIERYDPQSDQELGFEKGDFFHVIGHENDTEWFEACNPATNARGFVPVPFFQIIGKNERDSQDSTIDLRGDKDSGYSDRGMPPPDRTSAGHARVGSPPQSAGKSTKMGSPLYGIVLYDFSAERPDELEAKAGESIIVIAQSNEEWFVAKPIGRLGGPGLIPVDFIEIRDMVTGQPVEDARAAITRAGVPKVEEWKKMAAEYKNSSIALGKFEDANAPTQAMQNMSINDHRNTMQSYVAPDPYRNSRASATTQGGILAAPISASVDHYAYESRRYWYQVNAVMEDGRSWALRRFYEDFYDFQIALLDEFKEEAGHTGLPRILPYMPGPVTYVTDTISAARRTSLDDYVKNLLAMPSYISRSRLVKLLFAPRPGDVEMTGQAQPHRESAGSRLSSDSSREPSRQSSSHNLNGFNNGYPGLSAPPARSSTQQQQGRMGANGSGHLRANSDLQPPRMQRHDTGMSAASGGSQTNPAANMLKIKIEYDGELIAVRLPQDVTYNQLLEKLQERIGDGAISSIQYRDEMTRQMLEIFGDQDLQHAISRNQKLKLVVS